MAPESAAGEGGCTCDKAHLGSPLVPSRCNGSLLISWDDTDPCCPSASARAHLKPVAAADPTHQNVVFIYVFESSQTLVGAAVVKHYPAAQVGTCVQLQHHSFTARISQPRRPLPLT